MLSPKTLPDRVRVLVIGGGIHGAGVLHDLTSRGWRDVMLVEKGAIGEGTSSRSTKLIHGGLRYLQHLRDYGLVKEGLRERRLLMDLAGDIVKPIELYFPILKRGGMNGLLVKTGLAIYDWLSGKDNIENHGRVLPAEAVKKINLLDVEKFSKIYSFWDGQTDDLRLTRRVVSSALLGGATVAEHTKVEKLSADENGWKILLRCADGSTKSVSALHVVNAAGP